MAFDLNRARRNLQTSNFRKLFIEEMGWDHPTSDLDIQYNGDQLHLTAVAHKRGLTVFICSPLESGQIPDYADRRKIETQLRKLIHEHILIFTNEDYTKQVWQWVRREPGRPTTSREYEYYQGQSGQALLERLQGLVFTLEEEESLGIIDVASRVRATFDVERVTRRFYDRFREEHAAFMRFLKGIPDEGMLRWYVSVTLNRLMFVYFIQKKQFLDGDENYLRSKLIESKSKGQDLFYNDFLCPLFFEGFAMNKEERKPEMRRLLGDVPYLNGGIFQQHQIEIAYGKKIQISDSAFERVFNFFDQYRWHLDERPLRNDSEINPDVLGYIFEKYINQKEMGAYYTKEDITGYISRSTILPYLLDQAQKDCAIAFKGGQSVWRLLSSDPRRYIFPSIQKGCDLSLPAEIQAGVEDASKREGWNKAALEEYTLPTETWREVVARRTRYEDLVQKLGTGEIHEVNDLITYNLDIEQFSQDVVEASEGPELLRAFWKALRGIKVLDPTCGSGAFLFAALNILEPLYEACLERMRVFVAELEQSAEKHRPEKFSDFREVLDQVEQHHNERYFILKSIIVNNLYGVDIMEEAVEICKLRLFLKLIAQVKDPLYIEPLPDIDFNIRTGNSLIGFTTIDEVQSALQMDSHGQYTSLLESDAIKKHVSRIIDEADLSNRAFLQFQKHQLEKNSVTSQDKSALLKRLENLNIELNHALAKTKNVDPSSNEYLPWLENHEPFHWLVDFYGIIKNGGFNAIIGNPPYIEYSQIKEKYSLDHYETLTSGNLYAYLIERSFSICQNEGRIGMIVQLPIVCTDRMKPLQKLCLEKSNALWFSNFDDRPGRLFEGLEHIRATILISESSIQKKTPHELFTTKYNRWYSEQRDYLFQQLEFTNISGYTTEGSIPKVGSNLSLSIINKIKTNTQLGKSLVRIGGHPAFFHNAPQYWVRATNFAPYFWNERDGEQISTQVKKLFFSTEQNALSAIAVLNSSLFYWWFILLSDCRHLNLREIEFFPLDMTKLSNSLKEELSDYSIKLNLDFRKNSKRKNTVYKTTGRVSYDEFFPKYSKFIIDEIDRLLAKHYEFSDEELDFIINYDFKYRMGASAEETD